MAYNRLKAKQVELERIVAEFQSTTPESCVKFCLYRTALTACELLASNRVLLFPNNMYRHFMDYVAGEDIDLMDVSVSKSRLLTFLENEFGELIAIFCE